MIKTKKAKESTQVVAIPMSQQLTTEKTKASKAVSYANELVVSTKDEYNKALEEGKHIKTILENVTLRREEITKPMNEALKSTRLLFNPIESALENAIITIKSKMMTWYSEEKRREQIEQQKIADRVDRGTMKPETAVKKSAEIESPIAHVKTETATGSVRTVTKYRVVDKAKIPLTFMEPNMVAIKTAFRQGQPVPGVEAYEDYEQAIS